MRYIGAASTAIISFLVMACLLTVIDGAARGPLSWSAVFTAPHITWWNGVWSLIAAIAASWLFLDWRTRTDARKRRKTLAARARA